MSIQNYSTVPSRNLIRAAREMLKHAEPILVMTPFAKQEAQPKNSTDTVVFRRVLPIDAAANAAVPLIAQGMPVREARERAKVLLDKLNIGNQADKLPRQLSGGQQQRVAIARALVHEPRLVVCDEPTAALDARSGRRVMDLLREVAVAPDRACIIVTHDNRIFDLADRIIVLEDGRITHDGKEMPDGH
jgi:putative ABC transport system ATP-binding protein